MAAMEAEKLSFVDKKRFFEQEIAEQTAEPKTSGRKFSYLQEHEVDKMRTEQERKMSAKSIKDQLLRDEVPDEETDALHTLVDSLKNGAPANKALTTDWTRKPSTEDDDKAIFTDQQHQQPHSNGSQ